jgi:hypothetical protein
MHVDHSRCLQLPSASLRQARYDLAAAAADGSVWIAGGSTGTSAAQVTDDVEVVLPHCIGLFDAPACESDCFSPRYVLSVICADTCLSCVP